MLKPDENVQRAIRSLSNNPSWDEIMRWFRETYKDVCFEQGHYNPDASSYSYNAGRNKELYEFLDYTKQER